MIRNGCTDKQKEEFDKKSDELRGRIRNIGKNILLAGAGAGIVAGAAFKMGKNAEAENQMGEKIETIINNSQEEQVKFDDISSNQVEYEDIVLSYATMEDEKGNDVQYGLKLNEEGELLNFAKLDVELDGYNRVSLGGAGGIETDDTAFFTKDGKKYTPEQMLKTMKKNGMMKEGNTAPSSVFMKAQNKLNSGR